MENVREMRSKGKDVFVRYYIPDGFRNHFGNKALTYTFKGQVTQEEIEQKYYDLLDRHVSLL